MNRFATRSDRFMDAYRKGLKGLQAAWAGKRYRGHRVLPKNIMALFDRFYHKKKLDWHISGIAELYIQVLDLPRASDILYNFCFFLARDFCHHVSRVTYHVVARCE
ncbi:hypothetical protein C8R44DRAFT_612901 [Mycena epipterygia]|nr:hypothetical protein C8R44DRAFT_612901 [Mycena epipterygia]